MSIEIVPLDEVSRDEWWRVLASVFAFELRPEDIEVADPRGHERAVAAVEDGAIVGASSVFGFEMTVPGGETVPTGGLTAVAVLPSHRRRGVLSAMTRSLFDQMRERGEVATALWASESSIYGRFGYGVATMGADLTIDRTRTALVAGPPPKGRVRIVDVEAARSVVPEVYERASAGIPGSLSQVAGDWDLYFHDPEHWREGSSEKRYAIYEVGGDPHGYACYKTKANWEDGHGDYRLVVRDLQAVDSDAYRALFEFLFGIDLVSTIEIGARRLHEPLEHLLVEPRRLRSRIFDILWVALLDPAAALAARAYSVEDELTIEVHDRFGSERQRILLTGGLGGAECAPTDHKPDLVLSSADLASMYLGLSRLPTLSWVGLVEGTEEAILRAHRMFAWPVEPWCSVHF